MNEMQRQAYLEAMGIEVVYPRQQLAFARPSPVYEFPELPDLSQPEEAETAEIRQTPVSSATPPGRERKRMAVDLGESGPQQRRKSNAQPAAGPRIEETAESDTAVTASTDDNTLRFQLAYYRVSEQLAVLDEWPLEARQDTAAARELLQNILLALGINVEQLQAEPFHWPMAEDLPAEEASAEHARQALGGFIASRQQRDGFGNLLVFTGRLANLLPGASREQGSGDFPAHKIHCQMTCVESLSAMLALPDLKREVWQTLQPLRERLKQLSH